MTSKFFPNKTNVEFVEIKKNKTFIAKKANTFDLAFLLTHTIIARAKNTKQPPEMPIINPNDFISVITRCN